METKLEYFLDNGNIFNMFEIQKHKSKLYQKDRYSGTRYFILSLKKLVIWANKKSKPSLY